MKKDFKNSKAAAFLKKNVYYIVMAVCIVAIATMVTLAIVLNQPVENNPGGGVIDNPVVTEPDDNPGGTEEPDNPGGGQDVVNPDVMVFVSPIENAEILRKYSSEDMVKNPTTGEFHTHEAIDFKAESGQKILAVYDGVVESIAEDDMGTTILTILHRDNIRSLYASIDKIAVKVGDEVKKGQQIAEAANTMDTEKLDGVHLHFQMSVNGEPVDPYDFLAEGGK